MKKKVEDLKVGDGITLGKFSFYVWEVRIKGDFRVDVFTSPEESFAFRRGTELETRGILTGSLA